MTDKERIMARVPVRLVELVIAWMGWAARNGTSPSIQGFIEDIGRLGCRIDKSARQNLPDHWVVGFGVTFDSLPLIAQLAIVAQVALDRQPWMKGKAWTETVTSLIPMETPDESPEVLPKQRRLYLAILSESWKNLEQDARRDGWIR